MQNGTADLPQSTTLKQNPTTKTATARKGMYSPKAFSIPKAPAPTRAIAARAKTRNRE
jgi:hypothetical protein